MRREGQGENKRGRNIGRLERERGGTRDLEVTLTYLNVKYQTIHIMQCRYMTQKVIILKLKIQ